jgi:hypothetical protein
MLLVLSPGILNPKIHSAEHYSLLVLSPHILSPRIASPEQNVIEILSPHILGGSHETHREGQTHNEEDRVAGHEVHDTNIHGANVSLSTIDSNNQYIILTFRTTELILNVLSSQ